MLIEESLEQLRRERFAPRSVGRYLVQVARVVRENLDANPGAVRSVWTVGLGFFTVAFASCALLAWTDDRHFAYAVFFHTALWLLVAFAAVSLAIGLLRDLDGYRLSALNVPIGLTLARVVITPGMVLMLLSHRYVQALALFVLAALTDVADGWIARRWNQVTLLGTVLDPIVDIVFNFTLFAGLAGSGLLPVWVFGVASLRYGLLVGGATSLYLFVGPVTIRPTAIGRFTGIIVSALVALLVALHIGGGVWETRLAPLTAVALGLLLTAMVIQVLALGWYNLRVIRGAMPAAGRVVGDVRWSKP